MLFSRDFLIIALCLFVSAAAATGVMAHIPATLSDRGMQPTEVALAAGLFGGGVFFGRLGAAILMDRFFAPLVVFFSFMLGSLGIILLLHAPISVAWMIWSGAFLTGIITGVDGDIIPVMTKRYFGPNGFHTMYGLVFSCYGLGSILGPLTGGLAFDHFGDYRVFMTGAALACTASGLTILKLGRYRFSVEYSR